MKREWKRKISVVLTAATLVTTVFYGYGLEGVRVAKAETAERQEAVGISVATHSKEEIRTYLQEHPVNLRQFGNPVTYEQEPVVSAPYSPGELSAESKEKALNALNAIRYIAGIPDDVILDEEYGEKVQAGALINYVNGKMSHTPEQPADMSKELYDLGYSGTSSSNIAWASWDSASLEFTLVHSWMADDNASNIDRVGHRRWVLNPAMGKTGFGAVKGDKGTYSGMYSFDRSRSAAQYGVCWPAQTMPLEFFEDDYPWSISMGTNVDASSASVTLTRKRDGQEWNFSSSQSDGVFYVNNEYYGQIGCIIFRPDEISYRDGDVFEVEIMGLSQPVSYEVEFFALEEAKPSASPTPSVRPSSWPGVSPSVAPTKTPVTKPSATPNGNESQESDFVCHEEEGGSIFVDGYVGTDTVVTVPETINGKTVRAVGDAFRGNTEVEEIYLPETVKALSPDAFDGCSNLRIINLGGFSEILYWYFRVDGLFRGCTKLEKVMTGDTADFPILAEDETINLFSRQILDHIQYIYLGDNMSDVSDRFFYGNSLEWVEIGKNNSVYTSHEGIVYSADGKTLIVCGTSYSQEEVEIPYGVETIGNIGFEGCTGIKRVKIPETVTSIPGNAFWGLDIVIEAKENSYAAQYARENDIPVEQEGEVLPGNTSQPTEQPTEEPEESQGPAPGTDLPTEKPSVNPVQSPASPASTEKSQSSTNIDQGAAGAAMQPGTTSNQNGLGSAGTVASKPAKAVIRSLKSKKLHNVQVVLKNQQGVSGYQIQYGTKKKMRPAKIVSTRTSRVTLKKLKKNRIYYVRARAYRTENGRRVYGAWSSKKKIKVK